MGRCIFSETNETDGELLKGVQYRGDIATTHLFVIRAKTGTLRIMRVNIVYKKGSN